MRVELAKQGSFIEQGYFVEDHPNQFESALKETVQLYRDHGQRLSSSYKTAPCKWIFAGVECRDGHDCEFAHSLLTLFAAQHAQGNFRYKTTVCQQDKKCTLGCRCTYVHPGDLMHRVTSGNKPKTLQWIVYRRPEK